MDPVTEIITHSVTVLFLEKTAVKVNPFASFSGNLWNLLSEN